MDLLSVGLGDKPVRESALSGFQEYAADGQVNLHDREFLAYFGESLLINAVCWWFVRSV